MKLELNSKTGDLYECINELQSAETSVSEGIGHMTSVLNDIFNPGARCSSMVRALALGAMVRRIGPSWGGPIELFLVPASAPRLA